MLALGWPQLELLQNVNTVGPAEYAAARAAGFSDRLRLIAASRPG